MHSASFDTEISQHQQGKDGGEVLVAIAALVTEGRVPGKLASGAKQARGFYEGPHCPLNKTANEHKCDLDNNLFCTNFDNVRCQVLDLWRKNIPVCVEVLLTCSCDKDDPPEDTTASSTTMTTSSSSSNSNGNGFDRDEDADDAFLLEKWYFTVNHRRSAEPLPFNFVQLLNAIRSQLHFSQLTAWLSLQDADRPSKITKNNLRYRLSMPGETFESTEQAAFARSAVKHEFPLTDIGNGNTATVTCLSLPRMARVPPVSCHRCAVKPPPPAMPALRKGEEKRPIGLFDDRMHTVCTIKGKHRCEDFEDDQIASTSTRQQPSLTVDVHRANLYASPQPRHVRLVRFSGSGFYTDRNNDLKISEILLGAIERTGANQRNKCDSCGSTTSDREQSSSDNNLSNCDMSESDIRSIRKKMNRDSDNCDNAASIPVAKNLTTSSSNNNNKMRDVTNILGNASRKKGCKSCRTVRRKISFDDDTSKQEIPTPSEQARFRKDLDNAASMVFHSRTGLPLTSSPAPVRRGKSCFDFDSSINSVSDIKSALFPTSFSTDDESESDGSSSVSPCSPEICASSKIESASVKYRRKGHAANLLGSFEESVLNGRLEPVSTVQGFTAELGASGSFVPKHQIVGVTVFFYTLGDNDKISSPYLGHINLGKKGYNVPKTGTVQVTLFNPLGTVVKMFVIMYDLGDMPPNSQTFLRQRTFYMPTNCKDEGPKWLRYLIHLRFMTSKSGKVYLHSDIRMIIFRKSDLDTATAHGIDMSYELRSFTHMPANPRYSPRK